MPVRQKVRLGIFVDGFDHEGSEIASRLAFSDGTDWAADAGFDAYEPDARVARGDWAAIDSGDLAAELLSNGERAASNHVGQVRIATEHLRELRELVPLSHDEPRRAEARRELRQCALSIAASLPDLCGWRLEGEPIHNGFFEGPGGSANTTVNGESGLHVGLHLDSFDRLPPEQRRKGSNRLCINLGEACRSLQFVPVEASDMMGMLEARNLTPALGWPHRHGRKMDLARAFLATYPEAPVVRLLLHPGEAYLAPTENMIHDGIAEDPRRPDVTMTIRGYFVPCGSGS